MEQNLVSLNEEGYYQDLLLLSQPNNLSQGTWKTHHSDDFDYRLAKSHQDNDKRMNLVVMDVKERLPRNDYDYSDFFVASGISAACGNTHFFENSGFSESSETSDNFQSFFDNSDYSRSTGLNIEENHVTVFPHHFT